MNRLVAVPGRREELLGAHASALDDHVGLRARPLERLLDLGPGRVRELGGLVARLLEEPCAARLRLPHLGRRVAVGVRKDLAGLGPRLIHDLGALPLGLLADPSDLGLLLLEVHLRLADLLLGDRDLLRRGLLGVALDRVGELGGGADQVERVHPDRMPARLGDAAPRRGLEHAQVRLERGHVDAGKSRTPPRRARGRSPARWWADPRFSGAASGPGPDARPGSCVDMSTLPFGGRLQYALLIGWTAPRS